VRALIRLSLPLLFTAFAAAQSPDVVSMPAIEDLSLYVSFFSHHQSLVNTMQSASAFSPRTSAALTQQMAASLGVAISELPTVISNTRRVTETYAQIAADRRDFASAPVVVKPGQPNLAEMNAEFDLMQVRAVVDGIHYLFLNLSTASWNGIHSYITGTYKNTVYKSLGQQPSR
jgi:hypothetical protein